MFEPAEHTRVADHIVEQIEKAIIDKRLKPGDRLPPVRELQETFKAGRGTVRDALAVLKERGLVDVKPGAHGGAFIKKLGLDHVSEGLALLIRHRQVPLKYMVEFREMAEGTAAGLAAERAGADDIEELKKMLDRLVELNRDEPESLKAFYRTERGMHLALARMSRNPMLEWVLQTMHVNLDSHDLLMVKDLHAAQENIDDWNEIIECMEKGEVARVSSLIRVHVVRFYKHLKEGARRLNQNPGREP